jgi:hypothetical protein
MYIAAKTAAQNSIENDFFIESEEIRLTSGHHLAPFTQVKLKIA